MALQGLVVDVSDTLLGPAGPVEGIDALWALCRAHDIKIIAASNRPAEVARLSAAGYAVDFTAVPSTVGDARERRPRKPSPRFITVPVQQLGLEISKVLYLGDNERTDAFCAAHARVPFLRADWAATSRKYGIGQATLLGATKFIETYFLKDHPWFWVQDGMDAQGKPYSYRALLDCRDDIAGVRSEVKNLAIAVLKNGHTPFRDFFLYHLLASLHLSGLVHELDLWTTYPSHGAGSTGHTVIQGFLVANSAQFHDKALPLFLRHAEAASSRSLRNTNRQAGVPETPKFQTQLATCQLSAAQRGVVVGKTVLVVDDFTTAGFSLELARNLLLAAGAARVLCVAVGKFGAEYCTVAARPGVVFDPYAPATIGSTSFAKSPASRIARIEASSDELQQSLTVYKAYPTPA